VPVPHVVVERDEVMHEAPEVEPNPRWSTTSCRFDEVVELIYECPGAEEGAAVTFEVFEHDQDGEHELVMTLRAPVRDGVARIGWHVPYVEDADDEPTEVDRETGFPLPEFVFVARLGEDEARCDEQLTFSTDLELPVVDERGEP